MVERAYNSKDYKRVIEICEPKLPNAEQYPHIYLWLSGAYFATKSPELALKLCDQFLVAEPRKAAGYVNRAFIKFRLNLVDSAIEDCTRALELNPHRSVALIYRAYGFLRLKKLKQAESDLDLACQSKCSKELTASIFSNRARICLIRENNEQALKFAQEAVSACADYSPILGTRGLVFTRMKRYDEGLVDLSRAIELEPKRYENYWFRGELYDALRDSERAAADKKMALSHGYAPYL